MYCLASFCCVCLSNNNLQNINKTDIDEIPLISKLIFVSYGHEAIDLQIIKFICVDCLHMLRLAYKFKRTCLINNNLIKNFTCQLKYFTGKIDIQKNLIISLSHLTDNDLKKKITSSPPAPEKNSPTLRSCMKNDRTSQINYTKPGPASAKRRKVENIEQHPENKLYKCKYCEATFTKHMVYLKHCSNNHKKENINSKSNDTANIVNPLNNHETIQLSPNNKQLPSDNIQPSSENSNSSVQNINLLVQNTDIIVERKDTPVQDTDSSVDNTKASQFKYIQCDYCTAKARSIKIYRDHVLNTHGSRRSFICFICNLKLSHQCFYTQHMQSRHVKVNYLCKECKKVFFSNREFERHKKSAHKKKYKCKICQKYFSEQRNLKLHTIFAHDKQNKNRETIQNNEPNSVRTEDELLQKSKKKNYKKSKMIPNHLRGKMKCKNCLYTFSSSHALKAHICFKNKYMQQCKTCNIVYSKRKYLLKHMKHCNPRNAIENITDVNLFEPEENDINEISTEETDYLTFKQEESFEIKQEEQILEENLFQDDNENSDKRFEIENIFFVNEFLELELGDKDSNKEEQADGKDSDEHGEFEHLITLNNSDSLSNEDSHIIPEYNESRNVENSSNENISVQKRNFPIATENNTEQNKEITFKTTNSTKKLDTNKNNTQTRKNSFSKLRLFENTAEENISSINNINTSEKNNINETNTDFLHSSKSMDNEHFEKFVSQFNVFNNTEFDEKIDEPKNVTSASNDRVNIESTNSKNTDESDAHIDKDSDDPNTKTKPYKAIFLRRKSVIPTSNNSIKETLKVRNVSQINNDFKVMATTSNKKDSENLEIKISKVKNNFKCYLCSKNFAFESLLNAHLLIHSSSSKFQCITCKTHFRTQFELDRHIMITYQTGCYKNRSKTKQ